MVEGFPKNLRESFFDIFRISLIFSQKFFKNVFNTKFSEKISEFSNNFIKFILNFHKIHSQFSKMSSFFTEYIFGHSGVRLWNSFPRQMSTLGGRGFCSYLFKITLLALVGDPKIMNGVILRANTGVARFFEKKRYLKMKASVKFGPF